ncbi:MAG: hypothetical protein ACOYXC_02515, partial [Candidatus Rifleibacteriota bacterium]
VYEKEIPMNLIGNLRQKFFLKLVLIVFVVLLTGCGKSIKSARIKDWYAKGFDKSQFSDKLTLEETDLALAYCFKSISNPKLLEEEITVGEVIELMRKEAEKKQ